MWRIEGAIWEVLPVWTSLPKVILHYAPVPALQVANDDIAESNIRALTWDATSDAHHKSILEGRKCPLHVNRNGCGRVCTELTGWQAGHNNIVFVDPAQTVLGYVVDTFVFLVQ